MTVQHAVIALSSVFMPLLVDSPSSTQSLADGASAVHVQGMRHAGIRLDSRQYKSPSFALHLLECLRSLRVPLWSTSQTDPSNIRIHKVSGSLTNSVFFVSVIRHRRINLPTLLLRIYGSSSGSLISRPRELRILHVLSSQYHIGPRIYGTFENGRIEEYFDSSPLTPSDIRDPTVSRWIGQRMAEFHQVDIDRLEPHGWDIGVLRNVSAWLPPAEGVLSLPAMRENTKQRIDLSTFKVEWDRYMSWLSTVDNVHNGGKRVFAHNDTQYGNILKLRDFKNKTDEHRQLVVVDFEYAAPNPAAFDIANHFHEWTADYHSTTPHLLNRSLYPTVQERYNFYIAYLSHADLGEASSSSEECVGKLRLTALDQQVTAWSPASHAMWGVWGIVQGQDNVRDNVLDPDFDYLTYAICRLDAFRCEIRALGL